MTAQRAEMTCQELVELVTEYLEGALGPSERQRFEGHLQSCDGCTIYLEQMRQVIAALGQLTEASIPEPIKQGLLRGFRDSKSASG